MTEQVDIAQILQQGFAQLGTQLQQLQQQITASQQPRHPEIPEGFFTPVTRSPSLTSSSSTLSATPSPSPRQPTETIIPGYLREQRDITELPKGRKTREGCDYAAALRFFKCSNSFIKGKPMTAQSESSRSAVLAAMAQLYPNMDPKFHAQKLSQSCLNDTNLIRAKDKENMPQKRAAQQQAKQHAEMMEKFNTIMAGEGQQHPKVLHQHLLSCLHHLSFFFTEGQKDCLRPYFKLQTGHGGSPVQPTGKMVPIYPIRSFFIASKLIFLIFAV
jgi:hypothetical protein